MSRETKSPIKNLPVRVPGQSVDEELNKIPVDKMMEPFLWMLIMTVVAFLEWWGYLFSLKPMPVLYTVLAMAALVWAVWKIRRARLEMKNLRLGLTGERAVGQYLEEVLRPLKYHVLHDILGEGFNVDHVIVGPTGVFSVETKTYSKPAKGASSVQYDGETVKVNGFAPERDPIVQAKAEAHWLHELLESSTGRKIPVQPIVLFPGWWVEKMPANAEVWVLNEKALPTFIQNAKGSLSTEDVSLIIFHLKRYVIAKSQETK